LQQAPQEEIAELLGRKRYARVGDGGAITATATSPGR
jgi:hypothetical protein